MPQWSPKPISMENKSCIQQKARHEYQNPKIEVEFEAGIVRGKQVRPSGTRTEKLILPETSLKNRDTFKMSRLKTALANPELHAGGKPQAKVRAKRLTWPQAQLEEVARSPSSEGLGLPIEKLH